MSLQFQNSIGQRISVGDPVVYIGYQHHRYEGEFQGVTPGGQVRIALKGGKKAYKYKWSGSKGKVFDQYNRSIWEIYPGALMVEKATGKLITYSDWSKLSYDERYGKGWKDSLYERHPGVLRDGYEEVIVPNIFNGPVGLDRTFRVE